MMQRILAIVVVALLAVPWPARPCSCGETSLRESLEDAEAVFAGKVIRLEVLGTENGVDTIRATLQPLEVVKGSLSKEVELLTDNGCCYCSFGFLIGQRYLIFANKHDGVLSTSICTRSGRFDADHVEADLKALGLERLLAKPGKSGG